MRAKPTNQGVGGSAPKALGLKTTLWNVVRAAGSEPSPKKEEALAYVLQNYWHPLYAYARRRGHSPEDAQDLIQSFFVHLIEQRGLRHADPERGRFRSFLLASLDHFVANAQDARKAIKRGGRLVFLPLSSAELEARHIERSAEDLTPEKAFDRHWALAVLAVVFKRLREEQEVAGHSEAFDLLKPYLEGDPATSRPAELSARLQVSESGVRMMVLRLRRRCRALILEEIARTLADPGQVQEELQSLLAALKAG